MSIRERLLFILGILILGLSTFLANHILFILLSIIGIYLGVSQFLIDKKEKNTVLGYCRRDWVVWKSLLVFVGTLAVVFLPQIMGFDDPFDDLFNNRMSFYILFVMLGGIFATIHQNFFLSIRAYPEGFKMPGRKSPLVPWSEVEEMKIIGESLVIKSKVVSETIDIDRRDLKHLPKILDAWEQNNS